MSTDYGGLDTYALSFYTREIILRMEELGSTKLSANSIIAEIIDMVKPLNEELLTFRDIEKSGMGHWVIRILSDVNGFWEYENRENSLSTNELYSG